MNAAPHHQQVEGITVERGKVASHTCHIVSRA
jgi:hypothetical protein